MMALKFLGILMAVGAYLGGLAQWIYRGKVLPGILAIAVFFPALIWMTFSTPFLFLRAIPLAGLAMFIHKYGLRILAEIRLLWFTTLSVVVVQVYYYFAGALLAP